MMSNAQVVSWVYIPCGLRASSYNVREHKGGDGLLQSAGDRRSSLDFEPRFLRRRQRAANVEGGRLQKALRACGEEIYKYL